MLSGGRNLSYARTCSPTQDREILNDEVIIIHSSGSAGEPKIFEPYTGVHFLSVSSDVGGWSEALWERRSLDATTKGPWPQAIRAGAQVVWTAASPGVGVPTLLNGQAKIHATFSRRHSIDVIIVLVMVSIIDDVVSIMVWPEMFVHRRSVWSERRVRLWCNHGLLPNTWQL